MKRIFLAHYVNTVSGQPLHNNSLNNRQLMLSVGCAFIHTSFCHCHDGIQWSDHKKQFVVLNRDLSPRWSSCTAQNYTGYRQDQVKQQTTTTSVHSQSFCSEIATTLWNKETKNCYYCCCHSCIIYFVSPTVL